MVQVRQRSLRSCPHRPAARAAGPEAESEVAHLYPIDIATAAGVFQLLPRITFGEFLVGLLLLALLVMTAAKWIYDATVERWTW